MLKGVYQLEVESRGHEALIDVETRQHLQKASEWLCEEKPLSLALIGKVGNGKTTMMHAICSLIEYVLQQYKKNFYDYVRVTHARDIADLFRDGKDIETSANKKAYEKLKSVNLLIIDDVGTEASEILNYGNPRHPIEELLQYRYDMQRSTIFSSNLDAQKLTEVYGERTRDRTHETFLTLIYNGSSYR